MKLLFDTHAFLWWATARAKLSSRALAACQDRSNTVIMSVVSAWEIQVKAQIGKLTLALPLATMIEREHQTNGVVLLPIELPHVLALDSLPTYHKDSFDRLLIAQAQSEGTTILSTDGVFSRYGVPLLG